MVITELAPITRTPLTLSTEIRGGKMHHRTLLLARSPAGGGLAMGNINVRWVRFKGALPPLRAADLLLHHRLCDETSSVLFVRTELQQDTWTYDEAVVRRKATT